MKRRRRWDRLRVLVLVVGLLALFLPELVSAQAHDLDVPDTPVINPMYGATSRYYLDTTYDRWWHEVAACEGVELPDFYVLVRYVQVNYAWFNNDEEAVKHEMAHFLLYWAHIAYGGHPAKYFSGRCGFTARYVGTRTAAR